MTRNRLAILSLLTALAVAGCNAAPPGDFCAVVKAPLDFDPITAAAVVRTDRPTAERIDAQNSYWRAHCRA